MKMNIKYEDILCYVDWAEYKKTDVYIRVGESTMHIEVNRVLPEWEVPYIVDLLNDGAESILRDFVNGAIALTEPKCIEDYGLSKSHAYVYGSETLGVDLVQERGEAHGLYCPELTPYYRIREMHLILGEFAESDDMGVN